MNIAAVFIPRAAAFGLRLSAGWRNFALSWKTGAFDLWQLKVRVYPTDNPPFIHPLFTFIQGAIRCFIARLLVGNHWITPDFSYICNVPIAP